MAWIYAAHDKNLQRVFPADDGAGNPLGVEIPADQRAFVQMYVINPTDAPITTSAVLHAEGLITTYTKSASYLTLNNNLSIPPGANGYLGEATCAAPSNAKF